MIAGVVRSLGSICNLRVFSFECKAFLFNFGNFRANKLYSTMPGKKGAGRRAAKSTTEVADTEPEKTEKRSSKRKTPATDEAPAKESTDTKRAKSSMETPAGSSEAKATAPKKKLNPTETEHTDVSYSDFKKTSDGKEFNLKISSWNAGGLRALIQKGGLAYVEHEKPDIFCLQEVKVAESALPEGCKLDGYHDYWATGASIDEGGKKGYAGVAVYSKIKPLSVKKGLGIAKHDIEGRVITAEYEDFYLVNSYVPNSGRKLVTLDKRLDWNVDFHKYLEDLDKKKPVILTGDLNVSHQRVDLARPDSNKRSAGFTQEERDGFSDLLSKGFIDTFRTIYPDEKNAYTYWTYMANARAKNVGWRLDYFVISERLRSKLCDSVMRSHVMGSDHCPIALAMHM